MSRIFYNQSRVCNVRYHTVTFSSSPLSNTHAPEKTRSLKISVVRATCGRRDASTALAHPLALGVVLARNNTLIYCGFTTAAQRLFVLTEYKSNNV